LIYLASVAGYFAVHRWIRRTPDLPDDEWNHPT
jgi:hypothetical protein